MRLPGSATGCCGAWPSSRTLRALLAELTERGIQVSYYAVWHFFEHEGISFKKKPARQRAGSARCGQAASAMEEVSGPA
jgi:transposase